MSENQDIETFEDAVVKDFKNIRKRLELDYQAIMICFMTSLAALIIAVLK